MFPKSPAYKKLVLKAWRKQVLTREIDDKLITELNTCKIEDEEVQASHSFFFWGVTFLSYMINIKSTESKRRDHLFSEI